MESAEEFAMRLGFAHRVPAHRDSAIAAIEDRDAAVALAAKLSVLAELEQHARNSQCFDSVRKEASWGRAYQKAIATVRSKYTAVQAGGKANG